MLHFVIMLTILKSHTLFRVFLNLIVYAKIITNKIRVALIYWFLIFKSLINHLNGLNNEPKDKVT